MTRFGRSGRLSRICATVVDFGKRRWWVRWVAAPLVMTAPVAALAIYDYGLASSPDLPEILQLPADWLERHKVAVAVGAALWLYFAIVIRDWLHRCTNAQEGLSEAAAFSLFDILERVVGEKAARFRNSFNNNCVGCVERVTADLIFNDITKPEQQIALLTVGVHSFFTSIGSSGVSFKVTLAKIDEHGTPMDWMFYYPESDPPRTPMDVLKNEHSAICKAVKRRDLVVVEDIAKEARKGLQGSYACVDQNNVEGGSLLAYPILDPQSHQNVPYVITIIANQRRWFIADSEPIYTWVLKRFAIRIRLEHYLLQLKDTVTNDPNQATGTA